MALACNQTKVVQLRPHPGQSETYIAGDSKIYHQYTHDEPTDAKLGYQTKSSKLAGLVMQALRRFPDRDGRDQGGRRHVARQHGGDGASPTPATPRSTAIENIPMFIAGGAGGRHKAGQHVAGQRRSGHRVSLTAQQLVGAPVGEFGGGAMKTSRPITEVMA